MLGNQRVRAALLLTAALVFAVAGAYHAHDLSHEDDACAVCKLAHSTAQVPVPVGSIHPDDSLTLALVVSAAHPRAACALSPSSPRAPPIA
jgi:hypothetical protein